MSDNIDASLLERILEKYLNEKQSILGRDIYPPATEKQLKATEKLLGFSLPPLLRACYARIANGGFGPGEGTMGVIGGFEDNRGNIVEAYLWRKTHYRSIDFAECEKQAYGIKTKRIPFKLVSDRELLLPSSAWPDSLLEFFHHGGGAYSSIDLKTGRIFVGGNRPLWYEANSLEEWLGRWLEDDFYVKYSEDERNVC